MSEKIYEMLNDAKIDLSEYDDTPLNDVEKAMLQKELNRKLHAGKKPKQGGIRKWLSAAACVAIILGVGSGAAYAANGAGPVDLLAKLFSERDTIVASEIADSAVTEAQTLCYEHRNISYSLDNYWYDQEKGVIMEQVTIKTLDGTPFISAEEAAKELDLLCDEGMYESKQEFIEAYESGDEAALQVYTMAVQNSLEENHFDWSHVDLSYIGDENNILISPSEFQINLLATNVYDSDREVPKEVQVGPYFAIEGHLGLMKIVPTGTLPKRDLALDVIDCCNEAILTSSYVTFFCSIGDATELNGKINEITVTLEDGKIFCFDRERDIEDDPKVHLTGLSCLANSQTKYAFATITFDELIDIDAVTSVTVNGVECLK